MFNIVGAKDMSIHSKAPHTVTRENNENSKCWENPVGQAASMKRDKNHQLLSETLWTLKYWFVSVHVLPGLLSFSARDL